MQRGSQAIAAIDFTKAGNFKDFPASGFSEAEVSGAWSIGGESDVLIDFTGTLTDATLHLWLQPCLAPELQDAQSLKISIGDQCVASYWVKQPGWTELSLTIPGPLSVGAEGLRIHFSHPNPVVPAALGISADTRALAFMFRSLSLSAADQAMPVNESAVRASPPAIELVLERLDQALELARSGSRVAALDAAQQVDDFHHQSVVVLHRLGVIYALCQMPERARARFLLALEVQADFHYSMHELGDLAATTGEMGEAVQWYLRASQAKPEWQLGYIRAAALLEQQGERYQAMILLLEARKHGPLTAEIVQQLVDLLIWHRRREDAVEVLADLAASGQARAFDHVRLLQVLSETSQYQRLLDHVAVLAEIWPAGISQQVAVHRGHAVLALLFQRETVLSEAVVREARPDWSAPGDVMQKLRCAILAHQPFSLIRLGDGEARFLAYGDQSLADKLTVEDRTAMVNSIWQHWFGRSIEDEQPAHIAALMQSLTQAVQAADVVGVTLAERLAHDHRHFGYLAYLNQSMAVACAGRMTDAFVHAKLHMLSPFYAELLRGLRFLGVISPHPGLATRLQQCLDVGEVAEHLVPGEGDLRSQNSGPPHFPDRYQALLAELVVPYRGAVFLVAAGLLGKIYCHIIQQRGGIAIDIGSVADAWMGLQTRPGHFSEPGWALPATQGAVTKIAIVTMVANAADYLPIWCRHYASQLGARNMFVVDHGSDDGCTDDLGEINVMRLPRSPDEGARRAGFLSKFCASLLDWYDCVICVDADEILVADPRYYADLRSFCVANTQPVLPAIGLNVVQRVEHDAPYDPDQPVLAQRRWVFGHSAACKPVIIRRPVVWEAGFRCADVDMAFEPLFLFQLRWFDLDIALRRQAKARMMAGRDGEDSRQSPLSEAEIIKQFFDYSRFALDERELDAAQEPVVGFINAVLDAEQGRKRALFPTDVEIAPATLWLVSERFRDCF